MEVQTRSRASNTWSHPTPAPSRASTPSDRANALAAENCGRKDTPNAPCARRGATHAEATANRAKQCVKSEKHQKSNRPVTPRRASFVRHARAFERLDARELACGCIRAFARANERFAPRYAS